MEIVKPRQAKGLGMSASDLYRAAQSGRYDKLARGIYRDSEAPSADWDWIEAATRRPDATICLTSGLAYYDLTDAIPTALDVAIPRGSRTPAGVSAITWHLFDRATFGLGRREMEIPGSTLTIGIYTPERCIADAFRLRGSAGYELGRDALREWLRRGGKPAQLIEMATALPRAKGPLMRSLEALT